MTESDGEAAFMDEVVLSIAQQRQVGHVGGAAVGGLRYVVVLRRRLRGSAGLLAFVVGFDEDAPAGALVLLPVRDWMRHQT